MTGLFNLAIKGLYHNPMSETRRSSSDTLYFSASICLRELNEYQRFPFDIQFGCDMVFLWQVLPSKTFRKSFMGN